MNEQPKGLEAEEPVSQGFAEAAQGEAVSVYDSSESLINRPLGDEVPAQKDAVPPACLDQYGR